MVWGSILEILEIVARIGSYMISGCERILQIIKSEDFSMLDFIKSALPFVIIGTCLAIMFAGYHRKGNESDAKNYLTEGMCIGMCLGVLFSTSIHIDMGLGISLGMLIGETIGILIKKK